MKKKLTPKDLFALLITAVLILAGCTKEPQKPMRIGTNVWTGYEPLYLARDLGYFGDLPVKFIEYPSATEVMREFRNGTIEVAALTLDEVLYLAEYDRDFRIVLIIDYSNGADAILGRPGMEGLKDLEGKRVGAEVNALGAYMLSRALGTAGLSEKNITAVPLDIDEQERAFNEGKIDAVVTFDPVRSRLIEAGAKVLFDSSDIQGEIIDVLVLRNSCLSEHPHYLKKLLKGWFSALDYVRDKPEEASRRMTGRLKLKSEEVLKALELVHMPEKADNLALMERTLPINVEKLGSMMWERNLLNNRPDIGSLIDIRPLKELE